MPPPRLLDFDAALERILAATGEFSSEAVPLAAALGRTLRETVSTDRPQPPFDRIMMDGYAVRWDDWVAGRRDFLLAGSVMAGLHEAAPPSLPAGYCFEVATGAPMPACCDTILPVEWVQSRREAVVCFVGSAPAAAGEHIHRTGSDMPAGEPLLPPGTIIDARALGIAATMGHASLRVAMRPRLGVVATGAELVPAGQPVGPGQIRSSNAPGLAAALTSAGWPANSFGPIGDQADANRGVMEELLHTHDWLILCGAVSKGRRDWVPHLLACLGCREVFHGVAQRPGKPAGLWLGPAGQLIYGLPGNPVSAFTSLHALVMPGLAHASSRSAAPARRVRLVPPPEPHQELTLHLPVALGDTGSASVRAVSNSGDFTGLLRSDGFVTIPPDSADKPAPGELPFHPWY